MIAQRERNLDIEHYLLHKIVLFTMIGITPYFLYNIFFDFIPSSFWRSLFALIIFAFFKVWLRVPGQLKTQKQVIALTLILGVVTGFMTMGGLKAIPVIDLINCIFFVSLLFTNKDRVFYLIGMCLVMFGLFAVITLWPHYVLDIRKDDPHWFTLILIVVRLILTLNIGLAMKDALTRENEVIKNLFTELNRLNKEISKRNLELQEVGRQLQINNELLEKKVEARTLSLEKKNQRLLAYTFMNSHLFRAPIARLKGIMNLYAAIDEEKERKKLEMLLCHEIETIDALTYKISGLISEVNSDELNEIVTEAEKIYKHQAEN